MGEWLDMKTRDERRLADTSGVHDNSSTSASQDRKSNHIASARLSALAALYLGSFGMLLASARFSLNKEFYFDEVWRADYIGATSLMERYSTHDTPIPLAWLYVLRLSSRVLPDGFMALRLQSLALSALALVISAVLLSQLLSDRFARPIASVVGASSALLMATLPAYTLVASNFNDYIFQSLSTTLVVWLWWRYSRSSTRRRGAQLLASVVMLPFFTMSGLFLLPAVAVDLWARARRHRMTGVRSHEIVTAFAISGGLAGALYVTLYLPRVGGRLSTYWQASTLRGNDSPRLGKLVVQRFWDNVLPTRTMLIDADLRTNRVALAIVLALAAAGLYVIGRRWKQFPIALGSAFVFGMIASWVADWPLTPERVNLPYLWMLYVSITVGLMSVVTLAVRRPWAISVITICLLAMGLPPATSDRVKPFAQGLYEDLEVVANSPVKKNIVVSYHFMSQFYSHDRLVNRGPMGHTFLIVRERVEDPRLFQDLNRVIREAGWVSGMAVWCVIPFESGPDSTREACDVALPGLEKTVERVGSRANIVGWLPDSSASSDPRR